MRSAQFSKAMDAYNNDQLQRALQLMEECAAQGDPMACFLAALWHRNGEGTAVDMGRSTYWIAQLEELAKQGNVEAQWEIGQHYRFGDIADTDIERANYWLERAAHAGSGDAQHLLAWFFETGQYNYPTDKCASQMWYQRAFDQEHPETLYLYGTRMFRKGQPTAQAIELLKKAADKGLKQAEEVLRLHIH